MSWNKVTFTDEEMTEITRLYVTEKKSCRQIGKLSGCSKQVIVRVLKENGIRMRGRRVLTDGEEEQIVKMYKYGIGRKRIEDAYDLNQGFVSKMLERKRIASNRPWQYQINQHAFDSVDNEEASYWLGFIYADGCVYRNRLSVALAIQDIDHLKKLAVFLQSDHPIRASKRKTFEKVQRQACFYVNNDYLTQRLTKLGILKGRTDYTLAIDNIPCHLINHFLRGFVDGDGSIGSKRPRVRVCAVQRPFLEWMAALLEREARIEQAPIAKQRNLFTLGYYGYKKTVPLLNYLYRDATVYLERKKELADVWIQHQ
jgi:hypothetical protein